MIVNDEGVSSLRLELVESDDMAGLGGGGDGTDLIILRSLNLDAGEILFGGGEGDDDLGGSKRGDEGLGKDLVGRDARFLRAERLIESERKDGEGEKEEG